MPLDTWLVGLQPPSASRISVSSFPSFSPPTQSSACTAVEKTTRAKFPRPCRGWSARPGARRARTLTATCLPSESRWEGDPAFAASGASRVIAIHLCSARREQVWCVGIAEFASSHVATREAARTPVSQTAARKECRAPRVLSQTRGVSALGAGVRCDRHPGGVVLAGKCEEYRSISRVCFPLLSLPVLSFIPMRFEAS